MKTRGKTVKQPKKDGPIIMENGKIIDMDKSMIGSVAITEGMRYISKMTEGLATGSLSQDDEYISFRKRVLDDLIVEKSEEVRKKVETEEVALKGRYSNAPDVQARALKRIQEQSKKIADDNRITFYTGDDDDIVYRLGGNGPIGVRGNLNGRYQKIDIKDLKKLIDERRREVVEVRTDGGGPVGIDLDEDLLAMSELLEKHPEIVAEETAKKKKKKKKKKVMKKKVEKKKKVVKKKGNKNG